MAVAEDVHRIFIDGGVHPGYRRRGIGTALLRFVRWALEAS